VVEILHTLREEEEEKELHLEIQREVEEMEFLLVLQ
jgi:hypothetical protein